MSSVFTSTYHDTPDGRFERTGVALRRRVDHGLSIWEVELPEAPGEVAFSETGGPAEPPPLVAELLRGLLRGRELVEIVPLQARPSGPETPRLGEVHGKAERAPGPDSALAHLQAMINEQYDEILAHDPGTRLGGDPEALHKLRVAVRRLRAVLRVSRPILEAEWADRLRSELGWLGRALGSVRDHDVLLLQVRGQAETLPVGDVAALGHVVERIERSREAAREDLLEALSSRRYLDLLSQVELAGEAPRWSGKRRSVRKLAAREFGKLAAAIRKLGPSPTDSELHRVRVRAKRARYAGELAQEAVGKQARRFVARARQVQDTLGEHQDAVVAEARLRELLQTDEDPQVALVVGRLVERQRERRLRTRAQAPRALRKLRRAGIRAWA